MSFERVSVIAKPTNADDTGVRVSLVKIKKSSAKLRIIVDDACAQAFFGGDPAQQRFDLLVGRNEHHGLRRLKPDDDGPLQAVPRLLGRGACARRVHTITCGHLAHLIDRAEPAGPARWEWFDGELEIVLPKWADETRPKPPSADDLVREQNRIAAERRQRLGVR